MVTMSKSSTICTITKVIFIFVEHVSDEFKVFQTAKQKSCLGLFLNLVQNLVLISIFCKCYNKIAKTTSHV